MIFFPSRSPTALPLSSSIRWLLRKSDGKRNDEYFRARFFFVLRKKNTSFRFRNGFVRREGAAESEK